MIFYLKRLKVMKLMLGILVLHSCDRKLSPWSRILLEKLTVTQLGKTFTAFCWTQRCISVFTRAKLWSLWTLWFLPKTD